jgi:2-dehydro-3-deoxyglucarate aldolase/4-hydroxy-2-oxoheptanedioate aldolase
MIFHKNNPVVSRLRKNIPVSASWVQLGSTISSEILAEAGFDVVVADMEHSPLGLEKVISILQSVKGTGCMPFVRVPWNDMVVIKQVLDTGVCGIHVPYVSTKEEAEYAVKSCKYPPQGFRGIAGSQRAVSYGMNKEEYYNNANQQIIVMVAIETPEGVKNIDAIASVEGLDGIFIGPADLSTCMGYLGNPQAEAVQEGICIVEESTKKHNKFLGTVASGMVAAEALYNRGYSLVYFSSDTIALADHARREMEAYNRYINSRKENYGRG